MVGGNILSDRDRNVIRANTNHSSEHGKVEISYRPIQTMTVGIGIRYPFYESWKQTQKTYGTKALSTSTVERIKNNANMVYVNFVYNLPFGKPSKSPKQKITNSDKDSGIFNRL